MQVLRAECMRLTDNIQQSVAACCRQEREHAQNGPKDEGPGPAEQRPVRCAAGLHASRCRQLSLSPILRQFASAHLLSWLWLMAYSELALATIWVVPVPMMLMMMSSWVTSPRRRPPA